METSGEIILELQEADRWLDREYKNSNYYREYLGKVYEALLNDIKND